MGVDFVRFYCGGDYAGVGGAGIVPATAGFCVTQATRYHSVSCRGYLGLVTNRGLGAVGLEAPALGYECRGAGCDFAGQHLAVCAG